MESHKEKPQEIDSQGIDDAENVQHKAEKRDEDTTETKEEATSSASPDATDSSPDAVEVDNKASEVEGKQDASTQVEEPGAESRGLQETIPDQHVEANVEEAVEEPVKQDAPTADAEDNPDSAPVVAGEEMEVNSDPNVDASAVERSEPAKEEDTAHDAAPAEPNSKETVEQPAASAVASSPSDEPEQEDEGDAEAPAAEEKAPGPVAAAKPAEGSHSRDVEHDDHHDDDHHHDDHHDDHADDIDYDHLEKDDIETHLATMSREEDIRAIDRHLKPIKARFDELFNAEKQEAFERFVAEGNGKEGFEYREDEQSQKIHAYLELLREKRHKFYSDREKQKEENLKRKEEVLERIRELIDGEESDISIKGVKELQEEWKSIGPVPGQYNKTLWANYNALLDRFYDARSIYFELKDLDRKKNLDLKLDICERAEALDKMDNVKDAVVQLNELHEEFKHVGPIPRDDQEAVWQRFKAASDKIYVKRKGFVEELKKSLHENFEKKMALADETEKFVSFDSDRISEWNKKTKEIQALQRRWEGVGGVPRDKAKLVNKKFWGGFKQFFANKSAFFKKFEAQREENLVKKQELVKQATDMQESTDWQGTTERYKKLQAEWKEIGPVPEKFRNSIYEEFKKACDHFFDRRRDQNKEQNQEYEENYKEKQIVCDSIAELAKTEDLDVDLFYDLIDQYNSIGFVPRNVMRKIQDRFNQVTAQVINSPALSDEDRDELKINVEVSRLRGGPHANRKLFRKENSLRRKIDNLQNDINTWKTNMEFFASSKAADELKKDFEVKIDNAQKELKILKKELRLLND